MTTRGWERRASYVFLCAVPFLSIIAAGVRALRVPGVYQSVGGVLFAAIILAAWTLGARAIRSGADEQRRIALCGVFLVAPFALVAFLWVGLGPPWGSTAEENVMRYAVLLVSSIAVTGGFVLLKEALSDGGERYYSTLGFAAAMLAGAAYLIWMSFMLGTVARQRGGHEIVALKDLLAVFDMLLTVACALTYVATAAFAAACGRLSWLGRGATRSYVVANLIALLFLVMSALSFPDPAAHSTPWYTQPGFVAGIPAIPFIMPFLLGVLFIRRAGSSTLMD